MRLSILGFFLFPVALFAQVPQAFEFQGVARDLSGNVLVSQPISLRLGIVANTSGGALVYQETQAVTTSPLGLFTVQVGNGTPVLGTFAAVTWTAGPRFLKVELDPAGGSSYQLMGTTQLLSVPYALAAGAVPCFTVSATGDTLWQGNGCYVIIPGLSAANPICTDADGDGYFSLAGCGTAVDCNDGNPAINPGMAEVCDGNDNNCSGGVDEGNPGGGTSCSTGQVGVCAAGTTQCVSGVIMCVANTSPSAEVCNGLDDDCDGIVDDGSTCPLGQTCSAGQCQIGITAPEPGLEPNGPIRRRTSIPFAGRWVRQATVGGAHGTRRRRTGMCVRRIPARLSTGSPIPRSRFGGSRPSTTPASIAPAASRPRSACATVRERSWCLT
ncbi:MAG: putative metal-binding motif-containing protein [Flavobacteriales bacterium]|nr:putative metal-binding motif-containing protein [Flavobacteriales bacterium]